MKHDMSEVQLAEKNYGLHEWDDAEEPVPCNPDTHVGDNLKKVMMEDFYGADLQDVVNVSDSASSYFGTRKRKSGKFVENGLMRKMTVK